MSLIETLARCKMAAQTIGMSQMPPPIPPPYVPDYQSPGGHRPCPGCGGGPLAQPSFTWWGGAIGHKILGVERCASCKKWWVKKTGQPGGTRVAIYTWIGLAIGVLVAALLIISRH